VKQEPVALVGGQLWVDGLGQGDRVVVGPLLIRLQPLDPAPVLAGP
jgi:hypothetical protein